jgi:hypothetical protein
MKYQLIALFSIASMCSAQTPIPLATSAAEPIPVNLTASITVPPGTSIPLTLVSTLKSKSTKPGDSVRAQVAFPVTVGTQLAIPAGTYVEGTVNSVSAKVSRNQSPNVRLHFTRLLYANGYTVPLDAVNTDAGLILPDRDVRATFELADARDGAPYLGASFNPTMQAAPQPPPLPQVGPNPGVVIGATLGGAAALLILALALGHHHAANMDYVLFEDGWQFQIVLQQPLTLDPAQVSASAAVPAH